MIDDERLFRLDILRLAHDASSPELVTARAEKYMEFTNGTKDQSGETAGEDRSGDGDENGGIEGSS